MLFLMGKKIGIILTLLCITPMISHSQYYIGLSSNEVEWISDYQYINLLYRGIEEVKKSYQPTIKNILSFKRKRAKEQYDYLLDFENKHISHNGVKSFVLFKNEEEIKHCSLFGYVIEEYQDEHWLVFLGDIGSGRSITMVYVFFKEEKDLLLLRGLAIGGPITYQGRLMTYIVEDGLFNIKLNNEVVFTKQIEDL